MDDVQRRMKVIEELSIAAWPSDRPDKTLAAYLFWKLGEEVGELAGACRTLWGSDMRPDKKGSHEQVAGEVGDVLVVLLRICRLHGADPLPCVDAAISKFISRLARRNGSADPGATLAATSSARVDAPERPKMAGVSGRALEYQADAIIDVWPYPGTRLSLRQAIVGMLLEVREQALEKAAEVCEALAAAEKDGARGYSHFERSGAMNECAAAIRETAAKPEP